MTTNENLKKQKLRNAEYYDFQSVQDELYMRSKKNHVFKNLIEIITREENIKLAFRNIKKNKGSYTAGTDRKTIKDLASFRDEDLLRHVRKKFHWYVPQTVRRVEIPKSNGKTRPLGIPTIMDRMIQQCILQVLEPICEAKFHDRNNGFRPNRSTEHAIAQSYKYMQISKIHYVVDIDIKGFFDNVSHSKLLKQIWTLGIRDKKLICILSAMMKAEIAGIGFPEKGTPQGSIISPLLSNIVLNELDWWITSQWEEIKTKVLRPSVRKDNGKLDKGDMYSALRRSSNLKECYIIRYADDFKIFCRTKDDAERMFIATRKWLKDRLGLEISLEKSKIVNLKKQYSEFLGIKMKVRAKGFNKHGKIKYTVKSHISEKAKNEVKSKTKELIKKIQTPASSDRGFEAVNRYNAYILGVHNYYQKATHVTVDFNKIAFVVKRKMKIRLKGGIKKEGKHLAKCIETRYGTSNQVRYAHNTAIAPIGYVQHRKPMFKRKIINLYTQDGRAYIHKNLMNVDVGIIRYLMRNPIKGKSIEYNDNRLSLYSAQNGKCYISGKVLAIGNMHCHHKTPIKFGGEDNYENLVFVTAEVHRLIHATDKSTIDTYLQKLSLKKRSLNRVNFLRNQTGNEIVESCIDFR